MITYGIYVFFPSIPHIWTIYLCRCEWLPGACLCQGARHPPALPAFVASQSIPGTKEASDLTLTSQWTQVSPPCHYFLWGILGGEPSATVSILNSHSVYSHKFPALLTPGFATKSPQGITTLPLFYPQTLRCISFLKIGFCGRLITSEWQALALACWHNLLSLFRIFPFWLPPALPLYWEMIVWSYPSILVPPRNALLLFSHFLLVGGGWLENQD